MLMDLPFKILNAITFNLVLYFMSNLRREPGPFFFFVFTSFVLTLTISMFFRSIASLTRSLVESLEPAAILVLILAMYTGFTIPKQYMLGWARWITYMYPVSYGFESLMINEFYGRNFICVNYVPTGFSYADAGPSNRVCSTVGSVPGQLHVNVDDLLDHLTVMPPHTSGGTSAFYLFSCVPHECLSGCCRVSQSPQKRSRRARS